MKLGKLSQLLGALAVATTFGLLSVNKLSATTSTVKILGLSPNNILVRLDSGKSTQVKGIDGNLQARPPCLPCLQPESVYLIQVRTAISRFNHSLRSIF
jgi:hypothetical protein